MGLLVRVWVWGLGFLGFRDYIIILGTINPNDMVATGLSMYTPFLHCRSGLKAACSDVHLQICLMGRQDME